MIYEAIYKLTVEISSELAALKAGWQEEHADYYGKHFSSVYISDGMSKHTMRHDLRDQDNPAAGLETTAGYCDGRYYDAEAPDGAFRWLTCGGNLTRYDIDEQKKTVRVLLIGARHGLRMPPMSIQQAKPIKVLQYKSWRTDASPFIAGLNPKKEIDNWSIAQKIRWLAAHTDEKAVKLWKNIDSSQQLFANEYVGAHK